MLSGFLIIFFLLLFSFLVRLLLLLLLKLWNSMPSSVNTIHLHFVDTFLSRNSCVRKSISPFRASIWSFNLAIYSLTFIFTGFWIFRGWQMLFYFNIELFFEIIQSNLFIVFVSRIFNCRYFSQGLFIDTWGNCFPLRYWVSFFSNIMCKSLSMLMLCGSFAIFTCYVLRFSLNYIPKRNCLLVMQWR